MSSPQTRPERECVWIFWLQIKLTQVRLVDDRRDERKRTARQRVGQISDESLALVERLQEQERLPPSDPQAV